ncbi:hypothetical protein LNP17_08695 [Klebsiella variicola subsp. variicola]|nr:hypothetical protein [Klebsiella variicola subsp. variicola]
MVTDPRTGAVLALVSTPSYDPNLFVDGISSKDYSGLLNDPNTPLVNRATQGVLPAGVNGKTVRRRLGAERRGDHPQYQPVRPRLVAAAWLR